MAHHKQEQQQIYQIYLMTTQMEHHIKNGFLLVTQLKMFMLKITMMVGIGFVLTLLVGTMHLQQIIMMS